MDLGISGKTALVTGSTSGIGFSIAAQLMAEGVRVVVNGRTEEKVSNAVERLSVGGGNALGLVADLATTDGGAAVAAKVDELGGIDILVCNMAQYFPTPFFDTGDDVWVNLFNTNVLSSVRAIRPVFRAMIDRGEGRVILITSETALKPNPEMIPYAVTKTAQITLARGLAEMTKGTRVTVNSVLVAATMTEGQLENLKRLARPGEELADTAARRFTSNNPTSLLDRYATPEEVADVVTFLASPRSLLINGTAQRADGGLIRTTH